MRIPKSTNKVPIRLVIELSGNPATGVGLGDLTILFYDAAGVVATMDTSPPCELVEISSSEFPGEYLLKSYPLDLTAEVGIAKLKWAAVPAICDAGSQEIEVDGMAAQIYDMWIESVGGDSEYDAENSEQIIKDETGVERFRLPLENKDGGEVVYTGQGPVTRRAKVVS